MTKAQANRWIAAIERLPWGQRRYRCRGEYCAIGSGIHTFCPDVEPTLDHWTDAWRSDDEWRRAKQAFMAALHLTPEDVVEITDTNDRCGQAAVVALIRTLSRPEKTS